jgi:hypothetical protein
MRFYAENLTDFGDDVNVQVAEPVPAPRQSLLEKLAVLQKEWGITVIRFHDPPMLAPPVLIIIDFDLVDGAVCRRLPYGNGQPNQASGCFDPIAVSPILFRVLNIVMKNENVALSDEVKISTPGNV